MLAPCTPCGPRGPVSPVSPLSPCTPCGPRGPVSPVSPLLALYTLRQPDETYSKKASMVVLALVCAVGLGVSLVLGIPPLLEGLGG